MYTDSYSYSPCKKVLTFLYGTDSSLATVKKKKAFTFDALCHNAGCSVVLPIRACILLRLRTKTNTKTFSLTDK